MGKLHTLRRAIERDPSKWYRVYSNNKVNVRCAFRTRKGWQPYAWYCGRRSYADFVANVLIDLNIIRVGSTRNGKRYFLLEEAARPPSCADDGSGD